MIFYDIMNFFENFEFTKKGRKKNKLEREKTGKKKNALPKGGS